MYRSTEYNTSMDTGTSLDRLHNDFWDMLITCGGAGLIFYIAVTFAAVAYCCSRLGIIGTRRSQTAFWAIFVGAGVATSIALVKWQGLGFLGLGPRLGTCLGLIAFLVWVSGCGKFDLPETTTVPRWLLIAGLLSAIIAHLVEISFSFVFETSLFHFWIYIGLMFAIGRLDSSSSTNEGERTVSRIGPTSDIERQPALKSSIKPQTTTSQNRAIPRLFEWLKSNSHQVTGGLLIAVMFSDLGMVLLQKTGTSSAIRTIVDGLTRLPAAGNAFTVFILLGIGLIGLITALLWTNEGETEGTHKKAAHGLYPLFLTSIVVALIYWLVLARHKASMVSYLDVRVENLDQFLRGRMFIVYFHYVFMLAAILLIGFSLMRRSRTTEHAKNRWPNALGYSLAALIVLAGGLVIFQVNLRWSVVGLVEKFASEEFFQRKENWSVAVALHERAIRMMPKLGDAYAGLGKLLMDQAVAAQDWTEKDALFERSRQVLENGDKLRPLEPAFGARLANLYLKWGLAASAQEKKSALGQKAMALYEEAISRDPGNFGMWNNMAYTALSLLGSPDQAHKYVSRSIELHPNAHTSYGLAGDIFLQEAMGSKQRPRQKDLFRSALTNYQTALHLVGTNSTDVQYKYSVAIGKCFFNVGDLPQAVAAYLDAANLSPADERWRNEEILARLHADLKQKTNALAHLRRALELAPPAKNADLMKLQGTILALP
jgi:tetratricopeptide (TPR) repeat protein